MAAAAALQPAAAYKAAPVHIASDISETVQPRACGPRRCRAGQAVLLVLGQLNPKPMMLTHTPTAAGPGHALTAGLKVHHLPGGLYTLRHARPNYPLAGLTYEERARARAAGKAADVEALMELKGQVVEDAEGLLNSWQEGQDPCTFERVGEGLAQLALHDVSACMQATASTLQLCSTLLHCAAAAQQGALLHAVILQAELLLGRQATHVRTSRHSGLWPAAGALRCPHRPCV